MEKQPYFSAEARLARDATVKGMKTKEFAGKGENLFSTNSMQKKEIGIILIHHLYRDIRQVHARLHLQSHNIRRAG